MRRASAALLLSALLVTGVGVTAHAGGTGDQVTRAGVSAAVAEDVARPILPMPMFSVDMGWITGTVYFNRTETSRLASGAYTAAVICGAVGAATGGIASLACLLGFPRLISGAAGARAAGVCVGLRFYIGNPAVNWTVRHSGSRCR